ncbi:ABC transporter ATP-binding protein [Paenibacillus lentus]|uniref:ABC transporter ATP-binding protein n=1 Tax=Paenibacillus lentus TaxID=1338368 RepID=UPI0013DE2707|nr:ATP-binding cassette domain-containing protein [Paenibacillus lentus]
MQTIFEAKGLTQRYGSSLVLQDIQMSIQAGDIYGFIGENGAGKTTLMRIIAGLVFPTRGEISLFGKSGKELRSARRSVGFLIEVPALYPHMTAQQNLTFYSRVFGVDDASRIVEVLEIVSLREVGDKRVSEYSFGMRQRLGIAIALLNNPKFLVLDEPINGLDPSGIVEMRKILEYLAKEKGVTILISSHILSELQLLATKFGFIHKGRLVKEISSEELLKSAASQICVRTPKPVEVMHILKEKLNIATVALMNNGEIQIPKDSMELEKLMTFFLQQGIPIEGLHLSAPNLESYYMDLIGGRVS